jgi:sugar lactone lactonase YvrE
MKKYFALLLTTVCAWAVSIPADAQVTYEPYDFGTLAGSATGGWGYVNGAGSDARFNRPTGVAVDSTGNLYVADFINNAIRKITPAGVVSTFAGGSGWGSKDGLASDAQFDLPASVAVDALGNVYVADSINNTIRKITPVGVVTTLAGSAGSEGSSDGAGSMARFFRPGGVAVDSFGNVYVADTFSDTIRIIDAAGVVTTLAGSAGESGSADGTGSAARFYYPEAVAVDGSGVVYVADTGNSTIRKITPAGVVTTIAGLAGSSANIDGTGSAARFSSPYGVAVDRSGNVYVADTASNNIRQITPAGVVTTIAGLVGAYTYGCGDGIGRSATFFYPAGLAVDTAGNIFVAEEGNDAIRKITPAGVVTTIAGFAPSWNNADGTGSAARFASPAGVAADSFGNIYVADSWNHTIRKINSSGSVTTFAGLAANSGSADGTGNAARFNRPFGVTVDKVGNVYVANLEDNTVRKITTDGVVSTLAGSPYNWGHADGTGSSASFAGPQSVACDRSGNVFVADTYNNIIRKITSTGKVTTLAGLAGNYGSSDGTGSTARFAGPTGVACDKSGNVYVADSGNYTIRKITPAGSVTTLAGSTGTSGHIDGTGSAAQFSNPHDVATDKFGNVYVADSLDNTIRKITAAGRVTTLAGLGTGSMDGIGDQASFFSPMGITVDSAGRIYVADYGNNTIRVGMATSATN